MAPHQVLSLSWLVWLISWIAASFWGAPTQKKAGWGAERPSRLRIMVGGLLLFAGTTLKGYGNARLWPYDVRLSWLLAGLALLGFAFTWWARLHLGPLWSAAVVRKEGHRLVETGPYGIVRHPIYTGLLAALAASAALSGTPLALAGFAVIAWGFWTKARLEETFLSAEIGAEAHSAYAQRVPMLLPFGRG